MIKSNENFPIDGSENIIINGYNYIMDNQEDIVEYILNGPTEDTPQSTIEAGDEVRRQIQQIPSWASNFLGTFLGNND